MAVNLTPLHDRVIVKRIEEKETVKGGIIIPDSAKEKPMEGEVIAVGAGKREKGELIPLDVKPGDRVLFGKYGGTEIKLDGEEYLILREEEILAKLSGAAKAAKKVSTSDLNVMAPTSGCFCNIIRQFAASLLGGNEKWRSRLLRERIPARRFCAA